MSEATDSLVDLRLEDLLEAIAEDSTLVASGAVAAATAASAAGLVAMTARRGGGPWSGAAAAAGQGEVLRRRATELIDESAAAFDRAAAELEVAREHEGEVSEQRDWRLGTALRRAADAPLGVAEVAADVAALAAEVAERCDQAVRPDAVSACLLAESATAIAAHLVDVNLAATAEDRARQRSEELSAAAAQIRERVLSE